MVDVYRLNKIAVMDVMASVDFNWDLMPEGSRLRFNPMQPEISVVDDHGERFAIRKPYSDMLQSFSRAAKSLLALNRGTDTVTVSKDDYQQHMDSKNRERRILKVETPTLESNLQEIERILAENADFSRKITENNQKLVKLRENLSKRLKNAGILNEKCNVYGTGYYPNSICYGSKQTRF